MAKTSPTRDELLEMIRSIASKIGHPPSKSEFRRESGYSEHSVTNHFDSWTDAVQAAGLEPHTKNLRIDEADLLEDWGRVVRNLRHIPTFVKYRKEGQYSPDVIQKRFGPWSSIPQAFREFAAGKAEWADVVALLPLGAPQQLKGDSAVVIGGELGLPQSATSLARHSKLSNRPTYGNPIDFRGLRHEPVNEQGVVFLFGMVAKELGYMVEAVQTGFPDCEAKRQIGPDKWQRVRVEFEFKSSNFREHGHDPDGCDVVICWRHNCQDLPSHLEVVELASVIKTLSSSDD